MRAGQLGFIDTPGQRIARPDGVSWCADNGCYGKGWPGEASWLAWLSRQASSASSCLFATAPDVVGDAAATLKRSAPHLEPIRELGFRAALVAQDGLEDEQVPWDSFDALFIGGSTDWKLGPSARELGRQALALGKHLHMGRVNSLRRFRIAHAMGCHSVDGTFLRFGPDRRLPELLGWLRTLDQGALF